MQQIRTIRCKVAVDPSDFPVLDDLFDHYTKAVSRIARWGRDNRESNVIRLHHALYRIIRQESGLPANLVCTALRRASGMLKSSRMRGKFEVRPTFIALDERTFSLKGETVSWSVPGRRRIKATLDIGEYQRTALKGHEPTSATLVRSKGGFFINIVIETSVPDAAPERVLGVDLGIRNIAVTSTGKKFDGKAIRKFREERWRIRASLQSKGTWGAKKVLRKLSGYERRRMTLENHRIAKQIVAEAVTNGCSLIRMESLKGIRERTKVPNRHLNRMVSLWSFAQLQVFVQYKAAGNGISIEFVNPAWTSRTCFSCGRRGIRDKEMFCCATCGLTADADQNAAKVIAAGGAAVNRPVSDGQVLTQAKAS